MARTLPATIQTEIAKSGTSPGWLIEIQASTGTLRYSTRGTLTYNAFTWTGGAGVQFGDGGLAAGGNLTMPNTDNAASALALSDLLREAPVLVYQYYDDGASGEAVQLDELRIDGVDYVKSTRVGLTLSTISAATLAVPDVVIGTPLCNHLPAEGTQISWAGTTYTLRSE